jgi:hypothetical protein
MRYIHSFESWVARNMSSRRIPEIGSGALEMHSRPLHQCQKQSVQDHVVNLPLWLEEDPVLIQKKQELVHQMILCTKNVISTNASIAEAECLRSFYEFTSLVNTTFSFRRTRNWVSKIKCESSFFGWKKDLLLIQKN